MNLKEYFDVMSNNDLIALCNEIYDWHTTGNLNKSPNLYKISNDFSCSCNYVEELVLDKSVEKLGKAVLLLLEKRKSNFFENL